MSDDDEDFLNSLGGGGGDEGEENDTLPSDDDIASILEGAALDDEEDLSSILAPSGGDNGGDLSDLLDQGGIDALMQESTSSGSTILRHDRKVNSYKIALLRALNDVVLAFPDVRHAGRPIAVPLRLLAESWIAYYWPFLAPDAEILQGPTAVRDGRLRNDVGFRPELRALRAAWEAVHGPSGAAGGWLLVDQMRVPRSREQYDAAFLATYRAALRKIQTSLRQPMQYTGEGEWTVFAKPVRASDAGPVARVPGTRPSDVVLILDPELWNAFRDVSLWVEALAIHEWSLFTARAAGIRRGEAYQLLTERPDNRLPTTWERNQVRLLMEEGVTFHCPWTAKRLTPASFDIDHVVPVSVHPFHELWNLVPSDADFNRNGKRARLPGPDALKRATPRLASVYASYGLEPDLARALKTDVTLRFSDAPDDPAAIAHAVADLTESVATLRNVARF